MGMTFNCRVAVGVQFCDYVVRNRIELPRKLGERRKVFIKWYMQRNDHLPFCKLIETLAEDVLYIRQATLESIIFNER